MSKSAAKRVACVVAAVSFCIACTPEGENRGSKPVVASAASPKPQAAAIPKLTVRDRPPLASADVLKMARLLLGYLEGHPNDALLVDYDSPAKVSRATDAGSHESWQRISASENAAVAGLVFYATPVGEFIGGTARGGGAEMGFVVNLTNSRIAMYPKGTNSYSIGGDSAAGAIGLALEMWEKARASPGVMSDDVAFETAAAILDRAIQNVDGSKKATAETQTARALQDGGTFAPGIAADTAPSQRHRIQRPDGEITLDEKPCKEGGMEATYIANSGGMYGCWELRGSEVEVVWNSFLGQGGSILRGRQSARYAAPETLRR